MNKGERLIEENIAGRRTLLRALKFYTVGGIGIGLQLAALVVFRSLLHMDYRVATALAVEMAVIHNFLWHERFTWSDRLKPSGAAWRFAKFNMSNGLLSMMGNVVLMQILVGGFEVNYLVANLLTIGACSVVNFVVSDRVVFQES